MPAQPPAAPGFATWQKITVSRTPYIACRVHEWVSSHTLIATDMGEMRTELTRQPQSARRP